MRKLTIYTLANNLLAVPPTKTNVPDGYSGSPQQITHTISEGLVKRGHKVTLFASGDSKTSGKLFPTSKMALWKDPAVKFGSGHSQHFPYQLLGIAQCYREAKRNENKVDIIHSHFLLPNPLFSSLVNLPTVCTLHNPMNGLWSASQTILRTLKDNVFYVSISDAQRVNFPDLNYSKTIHHGVDTNKIKFSPKTGDFLIVVGRIHAQKGIATAIKAAKKVNLPLHIYGSHEDNDYWHKQVKPFIDNKNVIYKDFVPKEVIYREIRHARALLFPIDVDEAFGLAMIEAMASGTPVIAFRRGSVEEVVEDGKTGYVVDNLSEMVQAIKNIDQIDRKDCRTSVENKFSLEKMIDSYEQHFYDLAKKYKKL